MRTQGHPSVSTEAFCPTYNLEKQALNFHVFPNNFNGSGYSHQISKDIDLNLITTTTTKTSDLTFRYPLTQTTSTFPYQSTPQINSVISTQPSWQPIVHMNPVSLVPEASTFPQPKLHPYMQPTFSMHQQTRINAASIASGPSCNNAFLPDNREQRSNPHQSANYFLQPSLIRTVPPQTTLPEFEGQVSNFPQLTTYFDINRDKRDKIDFETTVKLPPIQIPSFDSNPLAFHDWLNMFNATVDSNTTISDTHRITYLQNAVTGKAKELIKGYSCNPVFYKPALENLKSRFGDTFIVVNAYIKQLEKWPAAIKSSHSFVSFAAFLKQMVQTFKNLNFNADLNSSTLTKIVKSKVPQDLLLKWTEYTVRNDIQDTDVQHLQNWLEVNAKTYDKLHNQFPSFNNAEPSTFSSNALAPCSSNVISSNPQASKTIGPENFNQYRIKRKQCPSCKNEHNIMQCPQYSSSTPPQRYNIVKQLELCVNCLSPHHLRTTCVSNNRCQECNGFHHTSLHDPNKFKKSTFVVNAHHDLFHNTMHPNLQEPVWGSDNFLNPHPRKPETLISSLQILNKKAKSTNLKVEGFQTNQT